MATLDEANSARQRHADGLAKIGAHAVGVEKGEPYGRSGWVVVAYTQPGAAVKLPESLTINHQGNDVDVPLVVQKAEPFEPQ
ncbi:hypothetical protein ABID19_006629 [Mesorhizobium robiniae]|uniref:Uncharacterized protein n=1 Tax=Mesorhizobium robiniae TaxID=559315 RepID=A0ABV2GZ52_9HYPH|nr:hypothetical protein [Mesorhizobium sp. ZC-5]MCV3243602.1 hypothetical protein [Mesorhizobium sp. ZC-5]